MTIDFCWRKAAECHHLAGLDDTAQSFFIRSRNSWIELANRLAVIGVATRVQYEEAWDSIISGSSGLDDSRKTPRNRPHRLQ
jgi:hypothetical protein